MSVTARSYFAGVWHLFRFWEYTSTDWAGLSFGLLVVTVIIAFSQVREAARTREAQARPFVVIDLIVEHGIINLTIQNTGRTMARDIRFTFKPELESVLLPHVPKMKAFGPEGMPTLAPGKVFTTALDSFPQREETGGLPDTYEVTITYRSDELRNFWRRPREFTDRTLLDLGMYRDRTSLRRYDLHDVHDVLVKIKDVLSGLSRQRGPSE